MVMESTSVTVNRMLYKVFKSSLLEITISLQRQRKLNYNRECRLQKETASVHFTATPQVSHKRKTKLCALTQSKSLPLSPNVARKPSI